MSEIWQIQINNFIDYISCLVRKILGWVCVGATGDLNIHKILNYSSALKGYLKVYIWF